MSMETIPSDIFDNDLVGDLTPHAEEDDFFSIVDEYEKPTLVH